MRSKNIWERIPTITEKLHNLSLSRTLPPAELLVCDALGKNACKALGIYTDFNKRPARTAINQVMNRPPAKSSVKIPINECPYHCLKYPLSGKPRIVSVISGMAAPTDNASASKELGQRRTTGKIKPWCAGKVIGI